MLSFERWQWNCLSTGTVSGVSAEGCSQETCFHAPLFVAIGKELGVLCSRLWAKRERKRVKSPCQSGHNIFHLLATQRALPDEGEAANPTLPWTHHSSWRIFRPELILLLLLLNKPCRRDIALKTMKLFNTYLKSYININNSSFSLTTDPALYKYYFCSSVNLERKTVLFPILQTEKVTPREATHWSVGAKIEAQSVGLQSPTCPPVPRRHCQWKTQVPQNPSPWSLKDKVWRPKRTLLTIPIMPWGASGTSLQNKVLIPLSHIQLGDLKSSLWDRQRPSAGGFPVPSLGLRTPRMRVSSVGKSSGEFVRGVPQEAEIGEALGKQCPRSSWKQGFHFQEGGCLQTQGRLLLPPPSQQLGEVAWLVLKEVFQRKACFSQGMATWRSDRVIRACLRTLRDCLQIFMYIP